MKAGEDGGGNVSRRRESADPSVDDERLQSALRDYYEALDRGEPSAREDLVKRYPDVSTELRAHFDDEDYITRLRDSAAVEATFQPGQSFGDFDLLEVIGRGGMGVVYKARQRSLKRTVALKTIRPEHLPSDQSELETETRTVPPPRTLDWIDDPVTGRRIRRDVARGRPGARVASRRSRARERVPRTRKTVDEIRILP